MNCYNQTISVPKLEKYFKNLRLTYLGDPELVSVEPMVAIVGSRSADQAICNFAFELARWLAVRNIPVVSGLAYGIDAAAHRGALAGGGKTLAVLGSGIDNCYPKIHKQLKDQIIEEGVVLSQFPTGMPPLPANFLKRNRIIAAFADLIIVVQAAERSGSLVTAKYGLEIGKEVASVPGSVTDTRSKGSNLLIQQGAFPILHPDDLKLFFGSSELEIKNSQKINFSDSQKQIIAYLKRHGATPYSVLSVQLNLSPAILTQQLLELEMSKFIAQDYVGNYVVSVIEGYTQVK
jgi:DNA processing protein